MCGFGGMFLFNKFNEDEFYKMSKSLNFRGPDSNDNFIDLKNSICLFHNRLAILDLSKAGNQPMFSFSKRYLIVYNGEIYNHKNIRKILKDKYNFDKWIGHSDTETLINSIELIGINETLNLCEGFFSFALWDKKNKELTIARDKIGEKPLYFGFNNSTFYFGSDLFPFKFSKNFKTEIDNNSLKLYFKLNYIPAPFTIYKDIKKLLPSHFMKISLKDRTPKFVKYWDLENNIKNNAKYSENELQNTILNKLEKNVKKQLLSDVPIGSFLSGGLDSSIVSYLMQKNSMDKIKTFNIAFDNSEYDESNYASKIAKFIGSEHNTILVGNNDFENAISEINNIFSEPFSDSSQLNSYIISKVAKKSVSVILSGDGGDEGFAGYNRHLVAKKLFLFNKIIPTKLRTIINQLIPYDSLNNDNSIFLKLLTWINKNYAIKNLSHRMLKLNKTIISKNYDDIYLNFFANHSSEFFNFEDFDNTFIKNNINLNINNLNDILTQDINLYLSNDIMCKVDRSSMAHSRETRMPLADADLLSFLNNIDYSKKVVKGNPKYILKNISKKIFPKELIDRPKMGFEVPLEKLLKNNFRDWSEDLLKINNLKNYDFLMPNQIKDKWTQFINGKNNYQHYFWNLLIFLNWNKS